MHSRDTKVALWLEVYNGDWFIIVSAPGIEIDRIGPYSRPEADAFIAGAKTFAPSYIGARPPHMADEAAQDLLDALKGMLSHSCVADAGADMKDKDDHDAERIARAAIAKAEGR